MPITKLPADECPVCHHKLDACTGVNHDENPKDGDYTVCIGCGSFLVFEITDTYHLRVVTLEEMGALDDDTRILLQRVRQAILKMKSSKEQM